MAENNAQDLALLEECAAEAGKIALKYFKSDNEVWMKPGDSPVSQADFAVNDYLHKKLREARPDYGWLSEESEDSNARLDQQRVFVVDPIDGTRGFINGSQKWCISVAIVEKARSVAAILECPALDERFTTSAGNPTLLNGKIITVPELSSVKTVTGSHKINDLVKTTMADQLTATEVIPSLAYRIAMVAKGDVDVAFARPGAHDWDLAAADLLLANAGGRLFDLENRDIRYNQKNIRSGALIACPLNVQKMTLKLAKSAGILH